jgi:hypothetical protein
MTKNPFTLPEHNYPLVNVGISASQNVLESTSKADHKEAASYYHYVSKGKMASLKFVRTADNIEKGYDENKAIFPVYNGVPLFAIPAIAMLEAGLNVHVLGSHEVGIVTKLLGEYYSLNSDEKSTASKRLMWVPETDGIEHVLADSYRKISDDWKLFSLKNSLTRLAKSFDLSLKDAWAFMAGDIIAYNPSFAYDLDIINNSVVVDFNGLETIKPPVPRNYYNALITDQGKIHFKEPNIWLLGAEIGLDNSDELYKRRMKGEFGFLSLMMFTGKNMARYWDRITFNNLYGLLNLSYQWVKNKVEQKISANPPVPYFYQTDLEGLCKFVFMSPIRIKADHTDWLRLKDVDAVHDYVLIRSLLENHIDDVLPENVSSRVKGFSKFMAERKVSASIPILRDFPEFINDKVSRVEKIIRERYHSSVSIDLPFSSSGELKQIFGDGEDLKTVVERTRKDLEAYLSSKPFVG